MKSALSDTSKNETSVENKTRKQIRKNKNKIKIKTSGQIIFKKYKLFVLGVLIIAVLSTVCVSLLNLNSSYIVMALRFSEIAQGYNPDGSPFDIYELLDEDVLNNACEKLDNKMDAETLKKHISLSSNSVSGSFNSIQEKVMDGNNNYYYFPNRYMITYSVISNKIKDDGIGACLRAIYENFKMPPKSDILNAVAEAYSEKYEELHIIKDDFFILDWEDTSKLDHFNRISEMQRIIERMSRYVSEKYDENVEYISRSGISFGDLSAELSAIKNIDLENYKSYVIQNGITVDKDNLIRQLKYVSNDNLDIYSRKMAEYNVMLEGIGIYDPNTTKITFIPSLDTDNEFYMNRTKIGIDYLTRKANAAKIEAEEANNTAQYYIYLANQFSNAPIPESDSVMWADEMSKDIMRKIDAFCEKAKTANKEYIDDVSYEQIMITGVVNGKDLMYLGILIAQITVLTVSVLFVIYCLSVFFKRFVRYTKRKEEKVNETGDYTESI